MILQVLCWIEHDMLQAFGEETDKKKRQRKKKHTELMMSHHVFPFLSVCVCSHFSHIGSFFFVFLIYKIL